ncbi:adenosylcobinamide-GDP ribazoletransferase [Xaviernesmea oryzae]|uniref:Adenosylcobinamide-GDP ribazoletransferase n=1 Tax=Xaviernesmea oryzae TaxID=464029 RepID=A0A1Q9B0F9_9HYPH|nr:adenosylcobinamide-GDP ribazoletransferase [Xaviernesmea oryzae]OLP61451.1 adenosylcobinamide-GDP ribazoletransferase [Xaviernesmea oryzae]SEL68847.1 cobalamin-5'-phosphate synthase [Xaviernesmea oryzae]
MSFFDDIARSIAFLSRLPVADRFFAGHDGRMGRTVRAFPLAGAIIAAPAAMLAGLLAAIQAPPLVTIFLAMALMALITGGLHEDGLADTADGLGGGQTAERALDIMKDSRIGSYGGLALIFVLGLRIASLAALMAVLPPLSLVITIMLAAGISRFAMLYHWQALGPARPSGIAAGAGQPETESVRMAAGFACAGAVLLALTPPSSGAAVLALVLCAATAHLFTRYIRTRLGGHTGDTIGATQQLSEAALLAALALSL